MKITGLVAAFFAAIGLLLWLTLSIDVGSNKRGNGTKRLSTTAEGVSYQVHGEPFPRVSCDSCKLGKLKAGVFSLSAFNVAEFENLVVNLPQASSEGTAPETEPGARDNVVDMVESFGLGNLARMSGHSNAKKIKLHGVKIKKFALNKMTADGLAPQLTAETIKNSGRRIVMKGVAIHREEGVENVAEAELVIKPKLMLKWPGGTFHLPY
jgi:hypothetical protein